MPRRRIPPQTWVIVAIVGYIVAISLTYLFLLRPLFTKVQHVKDQSTTAEEYLILKGNAAKFSLFKERVAVFNQITVMRTTLDSLAAPANVRVVSVAPDTATQSLDAGFLLKGFQVTAEGTYPQLNRFIAVLEQTNNYYLITRLMIVRVDERSGLARVQLTLRILTVPEPQSPPRRGTGSSPPEPSRTVTVRNG